MTPAGGARAVPAGGGSSPPLPGGSGNIRPAGTMTGLREARWTGTGGCRQHLPTPHPRKRVSGAELRRSFAAASAAVERRQGSALAFSARHIRRCGHCPNASVGVPPPFVAGSEPKRSLRRSKIADRAPAARPFFLSVVASKTRARRRRGNAGAFSSPALRGRGTMRSMVEGAPLPPRCRAVPPPRSRGGMQRRRDMRSRRNATSRRNAPPAKKTSSSGAASNRARPRLTPRMSRRTGSTATRSNSGANARSGRASGIGAALVSRPAA